MTQDLGWLLVDGYCYSHRKGGPFTIGEDFEAPGPAGRILPRIRIEQNTWDELWSFIANGTDTNSSENSDAEIFGDVTKRIEFENSVSEALSWYVSDCQFQAEIPAFRKELQGLRKTIEQFQSDVPDEFSSLGHFLYKTGFNRTVRPDAAPCAVNPTTGKRKHVSAIVIFTKQFHQFPCWGFTG